mmetsp:Transcript_89947/g.259239  ORF Transcript_89947/g.259239 Transcript_89947/m.259239 type:complete len:483 (+) Transcript_89947:414-1862(+)
MSMGAKGLPLLPHGLDVLRAHAVPHRLRPVGGDLKSDRRAAAGVVPSGAAAVVREHESQSSLRHVPQAFVLFGQLLPGLIPAQVREGPRRSIQRVVGGHLRRWVMRGGHHIVGNILVFIVVPLCPIHLELENLRVRQHDQSHGLLAGGGRRGAADGAHPEHHESSAEDAGWDLLGEAGRNAALKDGMHSIVHVRTAEGVQQPDKPNAVVCAVEDDVLPVRRPAVFHNEGQDEKLLLGPDDDSRDVSKIHRLLDLRSNGAEALRRARTALRLHEPVPCPRHEEHPLVRHNNSVRPSPRASQGQPPRTGLLCELTHGAEQDILIAVLGAVLQHTLETVRELQGLGPEHHVGLERCRDPVFSNPLVLVEQREHVVLLRRAPEAHHGDEVGNQAMQVPSAERGTGVIAVDVHAVLASHVRLHVVKRAQADAAHVLQLDQVAEGACNDLVVLHHRGDLRRAHLRDHGHDLRKQPDRLHAQHVLLARQ